MSVYKVEHICGHIQMHDMDRRNRDWKRAQLARGLCTDCWKEKKQAERKAEPLAVEVIRNPHSGNVYLAVTHGDTYPIKDALKAAGCQWREYDHQSDILSLPVTRKAWMIKIDPTDQPGVIATLRRLYDAGVTSCVDGDNPLTNPIGGAR